MEKDDLFIRQTDGQTAGAPGAPSPGLRKQSPGLLCRSPGLRQLTETLSIHYTPWLTQDPTNFHGRISKPVTN